MVYVLQFVTIPYLGIYLLNLELCLNSVSIELFVSIEKYTNQNGWYIWINKDTGKMTFPHFEALDAYWPGVLVSCIPFSSLSLSLSFNISFTRSIFSPPLSDELARLARCEDYEQVKAVAEAYPVRY